MKFEKFEDLPIWKLSLKITRDVYDLASQPKFSRDFPLRDQIRRAIISVSSNIVEGFEKNNNNEFIRYLKISKGSAGEVRNQLFAEVEKPELRHGDFGTNREKEGRKGRRSYRLDC